MVRTIGAALAVLIGVSGAAEAGSPFSRRTSRVPGQIVSVHPGDLDGDGLSDLVVMYRRGTGRRARRYAAVFFRSPGGLAPVPSLAFAVPKDAALYDVGPLDDLPGDDLAYLTHTGVWFHNFADRKGHPVRKLVSAPALVGDPEDGDLLEWPFLRRLPAPSSGTGVAASTSTRAAVFVPGLRDLRVFLPEPGGHRLGCRVRAELRSAYATDGSNMRGGSGGASSSGDVSLRVSFAVPRLTIIEATGDRRVDLVTHSEDYVAVHPGTEDGCFARSATRRQLFSMRTAEEARRGTGAVSSQVQDLDGDGIADLVLSKVAGGLTDLHTEMRFHRGERGGGFEGRPAQTLRSSGFAAFPEFVDLDGDGRPEMVRPKLEMGVKALAEILVSSSVTIDLDVHPRSARGGFFVSEPTMGLRTSFGLDFSRPYGMLGAMPQFGHDLDGDGRPDALISSGPDSMALHRGRAGRQPLEEDADFELEGPGSYFTQIIDPGLRHRPEVLVWYPGRDDLDGTVHVYRLDVGRR